MASPIEFQVKKVDPTLELQRRLSAAPQEHAEAILEALDLLEAAHAKGVLGLAKGAVSSKNEIAGKLAEYAKQPESTQAMRNLIVLGRLLGSISPDKMHSLVEAQSHPPQKPPTLWSLFRRFRGGDVRRGLGLAAELLGVLGSARVKQERS